MTYEQITNAINRIISSDDCTTNQREQLEEVSKTVSTMAPYIDASPSVVQDFMIIAGCIGV